MARSSCLCNAAPSHHYATHWPLQRVYDSPPPGQTLAHALHLPHRSRLCNSMRSDLDPSPTSLCPAFRLHDMLMCLHLTSITRSHTMPPGPACLPCNLHPAGARAQLTLRVALYSRDMLWCDILEASSPVALYFLSIKIDWRTYGHASRDN